jgi:hypothetical protein
MSNLYCNSDRTGDTKALMERKRLGEHSLYCESNEMISPSSKGRMIAQAGKLFVPLLT